MAKSANQCLKDLSDAIKLNPDLKKTGTVSQIAGDLWWKEKENCVKKIDWWYKTINEYLNNWWIPLKKHWIAPSEDTDWVIDDQHYIQKWISVVQCKKDLKDELSTIELQAKIKDNPKLVWSQISTLTRFVWWENKIECINNMWWITQIRQYIKGLDLEVSNLIQEHGSAWEQWTEWTWWVLNAEPWYWIDESNAIWTTKTTQATQEQPWSPFDIFWSMSWWWMSFLKTGLLIILSLFILVVVWKIFKYFMVFVYDVFNAKRYVFMRVILPRWDTKWDRDREKELAKDMKEKIWRMWQVYRNMHKLWELSVWDNIMRWFFSKAKITIMMHYEDGMLNFILWTYPEYKKIVEWAIAAQYAEASIETIVRPKLFSKKATEIMPMHPVKECVYPIRTFKALEDDPMNNIIDSIGKIQAEDTFTMLMTFKPESEAFNKRAQKFADALYKKDKATLNKTALWKKIFMPWKIFEFFINWPSNALIEKFSHPWANWWDPFIRMVKAEEEALNSMWEEAGKPAFYSWLLLISSSNDQHRVVDNIRNVVSSFSVFKDEYNNELDQPEALADLFGFILKPMWKFAATFFLPVFFFRKNIFTINETASLWHLPDGVFNRSPIIKWMEYKVLPCPDNLPVLKEENWYFMTWVVAEEYLKWNVSSIFKWQTHRAVWVKTEKKEEKILLKDYKWSTSDKEIIEEDGKKFVKIVEEVRKTWLKLFKDWVLLWLNVYRNKFTPIYMKRKDRSRHHYIIWKSGWGKSVYIASLARQDIWNGDGCCVIDPHGDLVEDILEYVPKERAKDIIYFDAWNEDRPMGLNIFEIDNKDQADRVVNDVTEIFLKMFGSEIFGPRIQEYFKYGALTLLEDMEDGATLIDVPRIFTDEVFREYKVKKVKNPVVRNFWERTYNAMGDREKQEIIPYFTSKFVSFITNRLIRNIIGQTKSSIRFREAMDSGKILLINLSKWKIWELNAQLLWMILVTQIYNAAMSRADIPENQRRDYFLYVDEFQNFVTGTFADILSEARKYHLGLIMAHQYIAQLEWEKKEWWKASVKDAVFGNVWTLQSFKIGAPDAEFLEKEYAPTLSPQDIIWISNYKVYIKLNINNATSRVFSMDTIWTKDYQNKKVAEILKEYSSKKYWRKREFVDAEITARLGMADDLSSSDSSDSKVTPESVKESLNPDQNSEWQLVLQWQDQNVDQDQNYSVPKITETK